MKLDNDAEWLFDFRTAAEDLGRILAMPAKVPAARVDFLRWAIKMTLADPALVDEGERTERYVGHLDAATTIKNVEAVLRKPTPEQKARIKTIVARAQ